MVLIFRKILPLFVLTTLILSAADSAAQTSRVRRPKKKSSAVSSSKKPATPKKSQAPTTQPTPDPEVEEVAAPVAQPAVKSMTAAPRRRRESVSMIYGSFSWLWWQEPLELSAPSGTKYSMLATANGPCFGGGWRRVKLKTEFNVNACFFSAGNEVGANQTLIRYYQQGVESYGIVIGPGYLWRPSSGSVSLGFQVPLFARYAQWTIPAEGYDVLSATRITGGFLLEGTWGGPKFALTQKVGLMYQMGALWSLGFNFRF
jgi:hypothetical protein